MMPDREDLLPATDSEEVAWDCDLGFPLEADEDELDEDREMT